MRTNPPTHLTTRTIAVAVALLAGSVAGAGAIGAHGPEAPAGPDRDPSAQLTGPQRTVIRQATQRFRDVDAALAAGYLPTDHCVELPGVGGMGYHYVNPELLATPGIDPTLPEILVYAPGHRGPELAAVEYFTDDADQRLDTDEDRPTLFGHDFDGPVPPHDDTMGVHYELHAWVFADNPAGELQPWNPRISCQQH